jgi:2-dehydro-3-deoxy-D-arabinonate dehydratase
MRFVQFRVPDLGKRLGLLDGLTVTDITSDQCATVLDVVRLAAERDCEMDEVVSDCSKGAIFGYEEIDVTPATDKPHLLLPIDAPEVWGCGVTYMRSASMRDVDSEQDIYSKVYHSDRPEVFFKATPSRCVGPNEDFGMRQDSDLTATEPELAIVLGRPDQVLGYSVCNDVSAWDIERENPLYLPQSKTFEGCCALGPCVSTNSTVPDPTDLEITCSISRGGETIYEGEANSSQIKFTLEQLVEFLTRNNPIPVGTVLSTGTGIMVPNEFAHQAGDIVEITIENIGTLRNGARHLS